jgi:hypothetical protein
MKLIVLTDGRRVLVLPCPVCRALVLAADVERHLKTHGVEP